MGPKTSDKVVDAIDAQQAKEPAADSLDLSVFLASLHQEINNLHTSIKASRDDRFEKAFQRLPRSMPRRTASHNARRLPRRLRRQAQRDQAADNTPSAALGRAKRRKARPAGAWVYENTKKRIKLQQEKKLAATGFEDVEDDVKKTNDHDDHDDHDVDGQPAGVAVPTVPRPPLPIHNLRLPTHRWQAKRAHMANPGRLWDAVVVKTPANKTYRASLRASGLKPGTCVCWDTSYLATMYLKGPAPQLDAALTAVVEPHLLTSAVRRGSSYIDAKLPRSFNYQHHHHHHHHHQEQQEEHQQGTCSELAGPGNCGAMTLVYNPISETITDDTVREAFLRVHPVIHSHVWTAVQNKVAEEQLRVAVHDFRLEVGSIDLTGTAAAEALAATLFPYHAETAPLEPHGADFLQLRRLDTTALAGASGVLLAFNIQDPRLDEPEVVPTLEESQSTVSDGGGGGSGSSSSSSRLLAEWPAHSEQRRSSSLFDHALRQRATRQPAQAALDKKRGQLAPGQKLLLSPDESNNAHAPHTVSNSPPIPVILAVAGAAVPATADPSYRHQRSSAAAATWTLLAPRACVDSIWTRLHAQPLRATGRRPLCAGLDEERHMALERGRPWFPADFPGTRAGWDWELQSRRRLQDAWQAKPPSKRTQWNAVDLGNGARKGELGSGFACDWEFLFGVASVPTTLYDSTDEEQKTPRDASLEETVQFAALRLSKQPEIVHGMQHVSWAHVRAAVRVGQLMRQPHHPLPAWHTPYPLLTVSVQLLWGGVPHPLARIYRLPATVTLRRLWLAQASDTTTRLREPRAPPPQRMPADADLPTRKKLLAQSLLATPPLPYPRPLGDAGVMLPLPDAADLIGFVTSGAHRFRSGKGFGIGHVSATKLVEAVVAAEAADSAEGLETSMATGQADADAGPDQVSLSKEARFCVVRNAGERVGHLARWTPISN
ncbi:ribonuclease p complex subunit [Niveomyces insectorum RCEF 264]|uniref:Ribonuclease p complex subunit n=1 Tax=Niveomyces insectorum RCEF 264 TaxID=1081102 RepID=A0A167LXA4_9HYPO|nr:ribonuclease p complex subunit [Niveomyces insectorum RCEF 264]